MVPVFFEKIFKILQDVRINEILGRNLDEKVDLAEIVKVFTQDQPLKELATIAVQHLESLGRGNAMKVSEIFLQQPTVDPGKSL